MRALLETFNACTQSHSHSSRWSWNRNENERARNHIAIAVVCGEFRLKFSPRHVTAVVEMVRLNRNAIQLCTLTTVIHFVNRFTVDRETFMAQHFVHKATATAKPHIHSMCVYGFWITDNRIKPNRNEQVQMVWTLFNSKSLNYANKMFNCNLMHDQVKIVPFSVFFPIERWFFRRITEKLAPILWPIILSPNVNVKFFPR